MRNFYPNIKFKKERENMGSFITMNLANSGNHEGIPSIIATVI